MKKTRPAKMRLLLAKIKEYLAFKSRIPDAQLSPELPIVSELCMDNQLEAHICALAQTHKISKKHSKGVLKKRLASSEAVLKETFRLLKANPEEKAYVSPASEWLLDNFYLVEEQIAIIKKELSRVWETILPQLEDPDWQKRYPRVYAIALQIIVHGDGYWDRESLDRCLSAYQKINPLTLAELWAFPLMLRLALIENLAMLAEKMALNHSNRKLADRWAERLLQVSARAPKKMILVLADMVRSGIPQSGDFVAQLISRLQNTAVLFPLSWIEQQFGETRGSVDQWIETDNIQQAEDQVSLSNTINGLRLLRKIAWRELVITQSRVVHTLAQDPAATFSQMDFKTQFRYCEIIQALSRKSGSSETQVAEVALNLAKQSGQPRQSHIGYYLIAEGFSVLEKALGIKPSLGQKICRWIKKQALACYLGFVFGTVIVVTAFFLQEVRPNPLPYLVHGIFALILAFCLSQLVLALVNWLLMLILKPQTLPRMNFRTIPAEFRSLIVIPSMLDSKAQVLDLLERLEVHYAGNSDRHLHFALLTDFKDAPAENMPEDEDLLLLAENGISALNARYCREDEDIFLLLHRSRRWNPGEQLWMGYERKRGKLSDLNNLLRKNQQTAFSRIVGRIQGLSSVKYVITLDSDTLLPRDTARKLVAVMAHPLNRPCCDPVSGQVIAGYGILQPRMGEILSLHPPAPYGKLQGYEPGMDPYTHMVSDLYQDLFQEGSFIGKGIYDVDLFQKNLVDKFPENLILSHDLLEGCYLRAGLVSDLLLYEASPENYLSDVKRRSRWIRGDWQLLGWLFSDYRKKMVPLTALSLWKISDNFRRSIVPIAFLAFFFMAIIALPASNFWLIVVLSLIFLPALMTTFLETLRMPEDSLLCQHAANIGQVLGRRLLQSLFYIACLPHEAWYSASAILRTCWRLGVSKRHLLEWLPSDQAAARLKNTPGFWLRSLWMGPAFAGLLLAILYCIGKSGITATPLLLLWFFSPLFAYCLSRPPKIKKKTLSQKERLFLRKTAARTWQYFATFVNAQTHWLPPDNYQEKPVATLALRTSPTNMGIALSANLTAWDFGYLQGGQLLTRTADALQSMARLEQYRGHWYNWYDLQTLAPLSPRYISTVDSGNLSGHLLTLRQGLLDLAKAPLLRIQYIDGIEDSFQLLTEAISEGNSPEFLEFQELLDKARPEFSSWAKALVAIKALHASAKKISGLGTDNSKVLAEKLRSHCQAIEAELQNFGTLSPNLDPGISLRQLSLLVPDSLLVKQRLDSIEALAGQIFQMAGMDLDFLYDKQQHLLAIGFNVNKQIRDDSYYDLMASEARLGIFTAIAQGRIEQAGWFALGRSQVMTKCGEPVLLSWSGSMFEYLMPLLIMPAYPDSLLESACKAAVKSQIAYGKQAGIPWGISEAGYNGIDADYNYQYKAFGVPELGLQPGLGDELVVAPYATLMALMIDPLAACHNLQRLAALGAEGRFGFYEALDYTAGRRLKNQPFALVQSFMAHHQGMSFLALSSLLHDKPMQKRFMQDAMFQSSLLLLQERSPKPLASCYEIRQSHEPLPPATGKVSFQIFDTPDTDIPQVQLLSNGDYHLMLTQAGGGYSRWKDLALTRWREDSTCDNRGLFCYIRDRKSGLFWSTTWQPTGGSLENFKAVFSEGQAEFSQSHEKIRSSTEIVVSPEENMELRRIHIYNESRTTRHLEFTSYAEVVLTEQNADLAQPAFSNLFIETAWLAEHNALLVTRRSARTGQKSPWVFHKLNIHSGNNCNISFESSRVLFIGRGGDTRRPWAMTESDRLSNSSGTVLDPIVALRCQFGLQANAMMRFDLFTGVAETREQCLLLLEKCENRHFASRIFELAWTHSQVVLHQLNMSQADASLYRKMASSLLYANSRHRAAEAVLAQNRQGQSKLWPYSISGDLPIILLYMEDAANLNLLRHLVQAQAWLRRKRLLFDLVIIIQENFSYRQSLQEQITGLVNSMGSHDSAGNVYIRLAEQIPEEDNILFQAVARLIFSDKFGSLEKQLANGHLRMRNMPLLKPEKTAHRWRQYHLPLPEDIVFFNGYGGFDTRGEEYFMRINAKKRTPAPWVNVLANPHFGSLISESGQGYTWFENAHECRLTPWNADPVEDSSGEAFYLRDDASGAIWSPTLLPCPGQGDYRSRHGFGYSLFEHIHHEIFSELRVYVAENAPLKFMVLKVQNKSNQVRFISAYGYVEWVLGDFREKNAMHITTKVSPEGAILAHNYYNPAFGQRTAFFHALSAKPGLKGRFLSGSRLEFLGRNGCRQSPAALLRKQLSGLTGAGLDPCAALQFSFELPVGGSREIVFMLGAGQDESVVENMIKNYQDTQAAAAVLQGTRAFWKKNLQGLTFKTPEPAVNFLANGWLLYQTLASRLWGRTGYYQSSGAFGFRDQLQDAMALVHHHPQLLRTHLLLCASRQFIEGDVQHWWHPPEGRGVRTRCSDDLLWLPFALCRYILATGDWAILEEDCFFLEGRLLKAEEESCYDLPGVSKESASLYHHAVRAIVRALQFGVHGLPLMGSGDWNDGMNQVGAKGLGESIWLGFFLYRVLQDFAPLAEARGDSVFKKRCEEESQRLQENLEKHGWDGAWYLRAYFDNGALLGASENSECQIDSIAQSWALLSKSADPVRAKQALFSLKNKLVEANLIKLLKPPFDTSLPSPGYIQGYAPGLRENGGQYTHAAVWAIMAFADAGEKDIAWELFDMINPLHHGKSEAAIARYKIEPYVAAGDVYGVEPHTGRGGWSWYTGSAGWMYRLLTESLLGIRLEAGNQLLLNPQMPKGWERFSCDYRYKGSLYQINVHVDVKVSGHLFLDGLRLKGNTITLQDDGKVHEVLYYCQGQP